MPRIFLITGAARGLGLAIATAALEAGDSVVATARNTKDLDPLVERYGKDRVLAAELKVTDPDMAVTVVKEAVAKFGRIDILINNAGYAQSSAAEDMSIDVFRDQVDVNFLGVVYITKAVLPYMRERKAGRILQVSSVGGRMGGSPGLSAYQAAKFAVTGFSSVLANEVKPFDIKVTVLEPGGIKTGWNERTTDRPPVSEPYRQTVEAFEEHRNVNSSRWPTPERYAKAIIKITAVEDPPFRLLLGRDTLGYADTVAKALKADDEKWANLSVLED